MFDLKGLNPNEAFRSISKVKNTGTEPCRPALRNGNGSANYTRFVSRDLFLTKAGHAGFGNNNSRTRPA